MSAHLIPTHRLLTHPGKILQEEFLRPQKLSVGALAIRISLEMNIPPPIKEIKGIVQGTISISPMMAGVLARVFNTSSNFWGSLQTTYDLALEEIV